MKMLTYFIALFSKESEESGGDMAENILQKLTNKFKEIETLMDKRTKHLI